MTDTHMSTAGLCIAVEVGEGLELFPILTLSDLGFTIFFFMPGSRETILSADGLSVFSKDTHLTYGGNSCAHKNKKAQSTRGAGATQGEETEWKRKVLQLYGREKNLWVLPKQIGLF